jgi:hypothetical protein
MPFKRFADGPGFANKSRILDCSKQLPPTCRFLTSGNRANWPLLQPANAANWAGRYR